MNEHDILIDKGGAMFFYNPYGDDGERYLAEVPPDHPTRKALEVGREVLQMIDSTVDTRG